MKLGVLFLVLAAAALPQANTSQADRPITLSSIEKPYAIGPKDVIWITVHGRSDLTGSVHVDSFGMMSMPLIGKVRADGLTTRQLRDLLTQRFRTFLASPEVDVELVKVKVPALY